MHLSTSLRKVTTTLNEKLGEYAQNCGVPNSALTNALSGRPIRAKTLKKLMSHPGLSEQQAILLATAWVEDRINDLGMNMDDFQNIPSEGDTIIRITGDPALVQALREIGIEATKEKKVYDMVMAIRDAVC